MAVPLASDFKVNKFPVAKVAPVPTVNVPEVAPAVMSNAVPKVAVAFEVKLKSFIVLAPLVKFKVPAVPPITKLELAEPVSVPAPVTAPLIFNALLPIDKVPFNNIKNQLKDTLSKINYLI